MKNCYTKHINCNLCGSDNTKIIQKAESPFSVVRCKNCGLAYVNPQPTPEIIARYYYEDYYREWIEKQLPKRTYMWKKRLEGLKKYRGEGKLLDVGCGLGLFIKLAQDEGFETYGTEISEYASNYAKNTLGMNIFRGNLGEAKIASSSFDIITLWHTLEHLPDPKGTLFEINRISKKNGLLIVAVPNLNNFILRFLYLLGRGKRLKLFSVKAKELHLHYFSTQTIVLMLKETGYKVLKVDMDLAAVTFSKKILNYLAVFFYLISRKNFGEAIKIYAVKA